MPDITEPARSPEPDAPPPARLEDAAANVQDILPIASAKTYHHTSDGKYVDTDTGEVHDTIPTD